jgi:hypothetical protein
MPLPVIWLGAYAGVTVVGGLYYLFGSDAVAKRQSYPWFLAFAMALFTGLVYFGLQMPIGSALAWVLFGSVIAVVHARTTVFCPSCARMITGSWSNRILFGNLADFCPRCGKRLDKGVPHRDSGV